MTQRTAKMMQLLVLIFRSIPICQERVDGAANGLRDLLFPFALYGSSRIYTDGHSYDHTLFRISEKPRAQKLLNAVDLFQDDIFP